MAVQGMEVMISLLLCVVLCCVVFVCVCFELCCIQGRDRVHLLLLTIASLGVKKRVRICTGLVILIYLLLIFVIIKVIVSRHSDDSDI